MKKDRAAPSIASIIKDDAVVTNFSLREYKEDLYLAEKERTLSGVKRKEMLDSLRKSVGKNPSQTLYSDLSLEIEQTLKTGSSNDLERLALIYQKEIITYYQKKLLSAQSITLLQRFNGLVKIFFEKKSFLVKIDKTLHSLRISKQDDSNGFSSGIPDRSSSVTQELTFTKLTLLSSALQNEINTILATIAPTLDSLEDRVSADLSEEAFFFSTFFYCLSAFDETIKKQTLQQYQTITQDYSYEKRIQYFRDTIKNLVGIKREAADLLHFGSRKYARDFIRDGQYQQAIQILCQTLLLWRDDAETYRLLANLFFRQKDESKAYTALGEALRLCPGDIPLRKRMAVYWNRIGEKEKAICAYEEILKQTPQDSEARRELGCIFYKSRQYERAIQVVLEYVNQNPFDWESLSWLAESFYQTGDYQHALSYGERALEHAPGDLGVILTLASCYRRLGFFEEAILLLEEKEQQFPSSDVLLLQLAVSYQECEKWPDAERCYEQFLLRQDSCSIHAALAAVQGAQEKWGSAERHYAKALELDQNHREIFIEFSQFLRRRGLRERAETVLRDAVERFPDDRETQQELLVLYTEMGRWNDAKDLVQRNQQSSPFSGNRQVDFL